MPMWSAGRSDPVNRASSEAGFTLLELLVVMGIMAMAYGLAVPLFSRVMPSVTLASTSEEVMLDLRRARLKAILSGKKVTFVIKDNGEGYVLLELDFEKHTTGVSLTFQERGRRQISFTSDGKNDGFMLILQTDGRERRITSDWVTGRIAIGDSS